MRSEELTFSRSGELRPPLPQEEIARSKLIININIQSVRPLRYLGEADLVVEAVGSVKIHRRSAGTLSGNVEWTRPGLEGRPLVRVNELQVLRSIKHL